MRLISSAQNPKFKRWKLLLESQGIQKQKLVLVMGRKIVPELLLQYPEKIVEIIYPEENSVTLSMPGKDIEGYQVLNRLFKEIDIFGTHFPILVAEMPHLESFDSNTQPSGIELVTAASDPGNLGGLLRSAEAFSASRSIVLQEGAFPFHPRVIRSSSGSVLRMAWSRPGSVVRGPSIREFPFESTVALDLQGFDISQFQFPADIRLLVGEEGQGLPERFSQGTRLAIPMAAEIESLNALAAGSIALFAYRQKHPLAD